MRRGRRGRKRNSIFKVVHNTFHSGVDAVICSYLFNNLKEDEWKALISF